VAKKPASGWRAQAGRVLALLLLSALALQLYFAGRIALMAVVDPQSTTFERSEAWRLLVDKQRIDWRQDWVDDARISQNLKRAVIASEDGGFTEHNGVEWDAIEKAWDKNQRAEAAAERRNAQLAQQAERQAARQGKAGSPAKPAAPTTKPKVEPKLIGGSTISQQLAKNLFLSGERTALRKVQEIVLTYELELILGKRRMLEIYLNHVEWGEGVFGAQAAARHYFRVDAAALGPGQAARLAVMLPAPKRFEKTPGSAYLVGRSATIQARMGSAALP
jgi:monofunctional biosynthetic peptidoglycan transglycosylase